MSKKITTKYEYRYYDMPIQEPILALYGDHWKRVYGELQGKLHFHNILEVGLCHYGLGIMKLEYPNEDLKVVEYSGGEVSVIPQSVPHTTTSKRREEPDFWEYLFIDAAKYLQAFFPDNPRMSTKLMNEISSRPLFFDANEDPIVCKTFRDIVTAIINEQINKNKYYEETTRALVYSLLMLVARHNREYAKSVSERVDNTAQIKEALTYMENHFGEELKVSDLAEICHMSETHFRRLFVQNMNMSPVEYMNLVRIQAACELLTKTNYSMETVAAKAGFQTVSTFNRNFHKVVGSSPYQWKKNSHSYDKKVQEFKISAFKGWE